MVIILRIFISCIIFRFILLYNNNNNISSPKSEKMERKISILKNNVSMPQKYYGGNLYESFTRKIYPGPNFVKN